MTKQEAIDALNEIKEAIDQAGEAQYESKPGPYPEWAIRLSTLAEDVACYIDDQCEFSDSCALRKK